MVSEAIKTEIQKEFKNVLFDEPMEKHTSFRTGGIASLFIMPEDKNEFGSLIPYLISKEICFVVIGGGSNLLVKDSGFNGAVICTKNLKGIQIEEEKEHGVTLKVEAGTGTQKLCSHAIENSLEGMNFAAGIPGTIGGAVWMNAGTATGSMEDVIESVGFLSGNGGFVDLKKDELKFFYRKLSLSHLNRTFGDLIITDVTFRLKRGNKEILKDEFSNLLKKRKENQPLSFPSAGSFFKNPDSNPAGLLIDKCGLKGFQIGGAMVSEKHGNFIVNRSKATTDDILKLAEVVKEKVYSKFGIKLEEEVQIVGS